MGISTSGGMIIGCPINDITIPEDYGYDSHEWAYENDMEIMSAHYDAGDDYVWVGFAVENTPAVGLNAKWLENVQRLCIKFRDLAKAEPSLIGMQNVT